MIRFTATSMSAALSGVAALTLMATAPATADDTSVDADTAELSKGEARLAKLLEGRVAGEPQNCISAFHNSRMTTIDETAYVYGRGNTIYVQRTVDPEGIDDDDVLVTRRTGGSQLCRLDITRTIDRYNGFLTGVVRFEKFVPYTRVEDEADEAS